MRAPLLVVAFVAIAPALVAADGPAAGTLRISEIVTDPQQDWDGDGRVTASDEYVELENLGSAAVDLSRWTLLLNDTTPTTWTLSGQVSAGTWRAVINPPGELNNNGHVALRRPDGSLADEVRFGSWPGAAGTPSADANGPLDEALALRETSWRRIHASPHEPNNAPQLRAAYTWDQGTVAGWIPAHATGWANASIVHSDEAVVRVVLLEAGRGNATVVGGRVLAAGTREALVSVRIPSPSTDPRYAWNVTLEARTWQGPFASWRIDRGPPTLPPLPGVVWLNATARLWAPAAAVDDGAGGVQWQWRDENGTATTWDASNAVLVERPSRWQARARDALGQASNWSDVVSFRRDVEPPPPVDGVVVEGEHPFRVRWGAVTDADAGVAYVELRRRLGAEEARWILEPSVVEWTDPVDPRDEPLVYAVRGVDQAGNAGPWVAVEADHEGRYPSVLGIRVRKPTWSSGIQEVRVDFDRAMAAEPPRLLLGPGAPEPDEARYLANRSTYYVRWDQVDSWDEGRRRVEVAAASAADGARLRRPAHASFVVDRSAPLLAATPEPGWTARASVILAAVDASATRIEWSLGPADGSAPAANVSYADVVDVPLPAGNWSLRAVAIDGAALRSREVRGVYRVDRVGPIVAPPVHGAGGWRVSVADAESGIDWSRPPTLAGWSVSAEPWAGSFRLARLPGGLDGPAEGVVRDLAGNEARFVLSEPPPTSEATSPAPAPEFSGGDGLSSRVRDMGPRDADGASPAAPTWWGPSGALGSIVVLGLVATYAWHRHRERALDRREAQAGEASETGP